MDWQSLLASEMISALDPVRYINSLRSPLIPTPYPWQKRVLYSQHKRKHINGARRAGKSVLISVKPSHMAKNRPGSVTLILGPTETQAQEDMRLIRSFIRVDRDYPEIVRMSDRQIELGNNSRIIVVPATEVSARGYPDPDLIITDEAAFIPQTIHLDCLAPMLNENPECEWIQISTTNGRSSDPGKFFYDCSLDLEWERYEIRAPYDVDPMDPMNLVKYMPEAEYIAMKAEQGIIACYSPRHADFETQRRMLRWQGPAKYKRNQLCEFVEPEDSVFDYDEVQRMIHGGTAKPLNIGLTTGKTSALYV